MGATSAKPQPAPSSALSPHGAVPSGSTYQSVGSPTSPQAQQLGSRAQTSTGRKPARPGPFQTTAQTSAQGSPGSARPPQQTSPRPGGVPSYQSVGGSPPASTQGQDRGFFIRKRQASSKFSVAEFASLVFVPLIFFVFTSLLFAYFYRWHPFLVWFLVGFIAIASVLLARQNYQRASWNVSAYLLPLFIAASIVGGTCAGLGAYNAALEDYWFYDTAYPYVNVLPSDPAGAYRDAGMIAFADETRLDTSRALGYKDDGDVYCVAPVVDDEHITKVQFWAVGVNCCGRRGGFACDDAWDSKARSGMVVAGSFRHDISAREKYMLAIKQTEAAFSVVAADEPVLLRWVANPEEVAYNMWTFGIGILIAATLAHTVTSCAVCGFMQHGAGNAL